MNTYEIIMTVLAVVFGGLSLYISGKKNVIESVTGFINDAETEFKDSVNAGGKKFEWVIDKIYSIIPTVLKPFITRELISALVQKVFDIMESYAKKQLDKVVDKIIPTPIVVVPVVISEPVSVPAVTDTTVVPDAVKTPVVAAEDTTKTV